MCDVTDGSHHYCHSESLDVGELIDRRCDNRKIGNCPHVEDSHISHKGNRTSMKVTMIDVRTGAERRRADFGWLDSRHTFSLGDFCDPEHMDFRRYG
jgi:hypothetical protein